LLSKISHTIFLDITPYCGVSDEEKFECEKKAVEEIAGYVPASIGADWIVLWLDYETANTPEAKAVKQLDKFVTYFPFQFL
jgi:5'-deoxynucleotidase YfbR-like HD superfamily hydrolase